VKGNISNGLIRSHRGFNRGVADCDDFALVNSHILARNGFHQFWKETNEREILSPPSLVIAAGAEIQMWRIVYFRFTHGTSLSKRLT
jgi:hypothetical protein